jgi:hypothetical protein
VATAPTQLDDRLNRALEATGELRGRLGDIEPLVRERWEEVEPLLRERWEEVEPVLRERWGELEPVVRERLSELEPAARQAQIGLWRALRALFTGLAALPMLLIRVLRLLAGTADEVIERGTEMTDQARKGRAVRRVRMRRRTLVACVGGAVGVGFVGGWILGRRAAESEQRYAEEGAFEAAPPVETGSSRFGTAPVE